MSHAIVFYDDKTTTTKVEIPAGMDLELVIKQREALISALETALRVLKQT